MGSQRLRKKERRQREMAGLSVEERISAVWDKSFLYSLSEAETEELGRWMKLIMVEPLIWEVESELVGGGSGRRKSAKKRERKQRAIRLGRKLKMFPACMWQEDTVEMLRLQLMGRRWPMHPPWAGVRPQIVPRGATPGKDYRGEGGWMIDQTEEQSRILRLVDGEEEDAYRNGRAWRRFVEKQKLTEWFGVDRRKREMVERADDSMLAAYACNRADHMLRSPSGRAASLDLLGLEEIRDIVEERIKQWLNTAEGGSASGGKFSGYWRMLTALEIFGSLVVTRDQSQGEKKGSVGDLWYLRNLGFTEMFITNDKQQYEWALVWAEILGECNQGKTSTRVLWGPDIKEMARKTIELGARPLFRLVSPHRMSQPVERRIHQQGKPKERVKRGTKRGRSPDPLAAELMKRVRSFEEAKEWRGQRITDEEARSHIVERETSDKKNG